MEARWWGGVVVGADRKLLLKGRVELGLDVVRGRGVREAGWRVHPCGWGVKLVTATE